jgi:hypothetical protein
LEGHKGLIGRRGVGLELRDRQATFAIQHYGTSKLHRSFTLYGLMGFGNTGLILLGCRGLKADSTGATDLK